MHAALTYCRRQRAPKRVVTLICDSGAKYLSKMYNDFWMRDQGFLGRTATGDLRDLIARRHDLCEDFVLQPTVPLSIAIRRMRLFGVSQLAVLDAHDTLVGIIDESDVLLALARQPKAADATVAEYMVTRVETIHPSKPVGDLFPIFRADRVAVVHDGSRFYGLITKIDLINHLRKQG
jgi:cystathionine beta-synthase